MVLFFALAYSISWILWAPLWLPAFGVHGLPVLPYHHALGAAGPIAAAFIMSWREQRAAGVANLARQLVQWRGQLLWIAIALAGPFVIALLAMLLAGFFDSTAGIGGLRKLGTSREFPQFNAIVFFLYNLISFGYGEETGWRGYALPHLQHRFNALWSSAVLTLGWALWHIPLFFYRPGYTSMDIGGIAGWVASLLTGSVLLTWLYNSSRGSILVVAIFHATIDIVFTSDIANPLVVSLTGALITIWGIAVIPLAGARNLARKERQKIAP